MEPRRVSSQYGRTIFTMSRGIVVASACLLILSLPGVCRAQMWDSSGHSFGAVVSYSSNEIVPGLTAGVLTSWYSGEFAFNCSVLLRDPYNDNKMNISPAGLYSLGATYVAGGLLHLQSVFADIIGYSILTLAAAMNSRHHLWFLGDPRPIADKRIRAALFVASRTDLYTSHGDGWSRYCPAIGLEFDFAVSTPTTEPVRQAFSGSSIAFDFGVEQPFDYVGGQDITNEPRFFAGVRFYFARTDQIGAKK